MSDESVTETARPVPEAAPSAGDLLRAAREATGLHIAALAVSMKVPVKKLEALEAGRFEELPDAVFVRALAASMCRALKIDPAPVLSLLPQTATPQLERNSRGINLPLGSTGLMDGTPLKGIAFRPAVLAVAGLLIAALVVAFYPVSQEPDSSPVATEPAPVVPTISGPSPVAVADASQSPGVPVAETAVVPSLAAAPSAQEPLISTTNGAPVATGAEVVEFKATSSSWIRVSDSQGAVLLEVTLAAGQRTATSAAAPLSIVVGNADATEVLVRGKPFALTEFVKDNVARFEVK